MPFHAKALEVKDLTVNFGSFVALRGINFSVLEGKFVTLLGPSGCGKTTLLRTIGGLVQASGGTVAIKGKQVNNVPIHKRNIGIVFQNYALFPHKSIFDNVAFGLKYRKIDKRTAAKKVEAALAAVRLDGLGARMPSQLSGGQQQRVALARALVVEPDLLLLDEPLSALDANLREQMRIELKQIQRRYGVASVFVTHDQEEALVLSDQIIVMNNACVEQLGAPQDIYLQPATNFVAEFVGSSNIVQGTVRGIDGQYIVADIGHDQVLRGIASESWPIGSAISLIFKGHHVKIVERADGICNRTAALSAVVENMSYMGGFKTYQLRMGANLIKATVADDTASFAEGQSVSLIVNPDRCRVLPGR